MIETLNRLTQRVFRFTIGWRAYAGVVQASFAILAFGLGIWGWFLHKPPNDMADYANNLFRTLQLITLQFPTQFDSGLPWQLHVARLMVPLAALAASLHLIIGAATRPARLALMPRARNHIVICGDQQLTLDALKRLSEYGRQQVVVLSSGMNASRRDTLESMGLTIVEGDPREATTLKAVGISNAAALFLAGTDDLENLNIAILAMNSAKERSPDKPPLILAVILDHEALSHELALALDGLTRAAGMRYHRLCPDREGLALELTRNAPVFQKSNLEERSHIMVFGLFGRWEQTLMQLIVSGQDHPTHRVLLTIVVSPEERDALELWRAERPELDLVAEFLLLAAGPALLPQANEIAKWRLMHAPPHLAVILRNDAQALGTALALRRPGSTLGLDATRPILVRQSQEDHLLSALGTSFLGTERLANFRVFGGLLRAESIARVLDLEGEEMAMALHATYQNSTRTFQPGSPENIAAWGALPETLRNANRSAVQHMSIILKAVGFEPGHPIDDSLIERMARIEHRRWIVDRIEFGWRYAPERNDALLLHPSLRNYEELTSEEQEKDHSQVRKLLELFLARGK
ncbi:MAG: RyR domain-containing protein [Aquidulcibacter sp.]